MISFRVGDKVRTEEGLIGRIIAQDEMNEDGHYDWLVAVPDEPRNDLELICPESTLEILE